MFIIGHGALWRGLMKRRHRICPVCGHLESEGTECCTECGARTIEYESGPPDDPDVRPWPEKKAVLPLVIVLAVAVIAFLPKRDSGIKEGTPAPSPESNPATPASAPGPCEASGHDWTEANYQGLQTCSFTPKVVAAAYLKGILPIKKDGSQSAISDFIEYPILCPDGRKAFCIGVIPGL